MEIIKNEIFESERSLFSSHDLELENFKIYPGETAILGESAGKYPFRHNNHTLIDHCTFSTGRRAAI